MLLDSERKADLVDLARLDDAMFARLYADRIEPCFAANESGRLEAVAKFKRNLLIVAAAVVLLGVAGASFANDPQVGLVAGFIAAVIGGAIAFQPIARLGRKLKQEYCTAIAEAMGASFSIGGFDPPALERLKQLRLVPAYVRSSFEDLFSGTYEASRFDLYEAHLQQRHTDGKGRTHYTTVFRGQLIRMRFPRNFLGVTIVRRDMGVFNLFGGGDFGGRKFERVRLVDPQFEKAFEVWGTDQVEARYLLDPVMMERLIGLESSLHGKRLRCAFEDGDVLVAVEGGNLFEPGDLFKPLVNPVRARRILDEIAGVVRLMDRVLTAQTAR
jgi:hypothetical protein